MKVSARMQALVDLLQPKLPVWDLCCDHGYMGMAAYKTGLFPEVHFVDQVPHIIEILRTKCSDEFPESNQLYYHSENVLNLAEELSGNIIIAGVGGDLVLKLIEATQKIPTKHRRWIISIHKDEVETFAKLNQTQTSKPILKTEIKEGKTLRRIYLLEE